MYYELIVLSFLKHFPLYAYMISKLANNVIGPMEKISRGTLSSLFSKLENRGLIEETAPQNTPFSTERSSRVYQITPAGEKRFYELMMNTSSNQGSYQKIFHIKFLHLHFLSAEDQLHLTNHYVNYCKETLEHLQTSIKTFQKNHQTNQLANNNPFYHSGIELIELKTTHWENELAWAESKRDQIMQQIKNN